MARELRLEQAYTKIKEKFEDRVKLYDEEYEIPLIIKKEQGRRAVLVRGKRSSPLIVSNLFETRQKMLEVFGLSRMEELYDLVTRSTTEESRAFIYEKFEDYYERAQLGFDSLGALKYYEKDGGYYYTSSIVVVETEKSHNASIHRIKVIDSKRAVARIVPRHLYRVYEDRVKKGENTPITILIGTHPIVELTASISPPFNEFEFTLIPNFTGEKVKMVKSPLHGNPVPLGTSYVVEAEITAELIEEGPFVDIMGTYDRVRKQPLILIKGIWALIDGEKMSHAILPGGGEHQLLMGISREAQIWKSVSSAVPKVHKVRLTPASGGWLHAVISIEKNHEEDGKNAILAAFGAHPSLKHVVVVDSDVDPDDPLQVEWAIATRFQADEDLIIVKKARGSTLDPSANDGTTSKMGLDATKPISAPAIFERAKIPGE
ncbi:MAG: UbiD family decarboxylase [Fervidicoccaceae archaeon]